MRILITNDDGINAPGLKILREAAATLSDDVWVAAPDSNQSGVSHALTLAHPLRAQEVEDQVFAIRGTPTDCVIIAYRYLMDAAPDLIISGVNAGQNVADHITYSGTVAGALEGSILGIKSIAFSQSHDWSQGNTPIDWTVAKQNTASLLAKLIDVDLPHNSFLNVNFPISLSEGDNFAITRQAQRSHALNIDQRTDGSGHPYYWIKFEDGEHENCDQTDLSALAQGKISITPIRVDMTDHELRKTLGQTLL